MNDTQSSPEFPHRRIRAADGMPVTAEVWEEAHDYHRLEQRSHLRYGHGPGIVTGLEVIASSPPDSFVNISPGIAVDARGQTIVLREQTGYNLSQSEGRADGRLFLLLSYEEGEPEAPAAPVDGPQYVSDGYTIEARRSLPETPHVELARFVRHDSEAAVRNAQDPEHPVLNEIDLRFRQKVGGAPHRVASLGVCYVGGMSDRRHGRGASSLARSLRLSGQLAWVDDDVPLAEGLEAYTLLCVVSQTSFHITRDEMTALYSYLQQGGTVLFEHCRQQTADGDESISVSLDELLMTLGVDDLKQVVPGHPLLSQPHLFAVPPPGFDDAGPPEMWVDDGVLRSGSDYGCLWQGERCGRPATREEIRTAMEWGHNLVAYALARQEDGEP